MDLATVALVGGGPWFVLRPGPHFDPSLWGNPGNVRIRCIRSNLVQTGIASEISPRPLPIWRLISAATYLDRTLSGTDDAVWR